MNKLTFFVFTALLLAIAPVDANTFILTITEDSHWTTTRTGSFTNAP